jgi:hypothetical protein
MAAVVREADVPSHERKKKRDAPAGAREWPGRFESETPVEELTGKACKCSNEHERVADERKAE